MLDGHSVVNLNASTQDMVGWYITPLAMVAIVDSPLIFLLIRTLILG